MIYRSRSFKHKDFQTGVNHIFEPIPLNMFSIILDKDTESKPFNLQRKQNWVK